MADPRDKSALVDILVTAGLTIEYASSINEDHFSVDQEAQDIIIRRLTIIGEAVRRLSPELRNRHTTIPFQQIIGMRNALVHDYDGIVLPDVWQTVINDLPTLRDSISEILKKDYDYTLENNNSWNSQLVYQIELARKPYYHIS